MDLQFKRLFRTNDSFKILDTILYVALPKLGIKSTSLKSHEKMNSLQIKKHVTYAKCHTLAIGINNNFLCFIVC